MLSIKVKESKIEVGQQNLNNSTIQVKAESGNTLSAPLLIDYIGDIYFMYDNVEVYLKWL